MIFPAMMFLLGFLCAGLLALLILPPVIRKSTSPAGKRRKVPQNIREAEAGKDRLRAEFAVSLRKQEHSIEKLKQRAQAYLIEIAERNIRIRSMQEKMEKVTDLADRRYKDKKELESRLQNLQGPAAAKPVAAVPSAAAAKDKQPEKAGISRARTGPVRLPGTTASKKPGRGALASRIQNLKNSD